MTNNNKMRLYSMNEIKDEFIGKQGTAHRDRYEQELQMDVLGEIIKKVRLERKLTQEQLGKIVGVQKAQISKLENNATNVTMETILKVFTALKTKISIHVELERQRSRMTR